MLTWLRTGSCRRPTRWGGFITGLVWRINEGKLGFSKSTDWIFFFFFFAQRRPDCSVAYDEARSPKRPWPLSFPLVFSIRTLTVKREKREKSSSSSSMENGRKQNTAICGDSCSSGVPSSFFSFSFFVVPYFARHEADMRGQLSLPVHTFILRLF